MSIDILYLFVFLVTLFNISSCEKQIHRLLLGFDWVSIFVLGISFEPICGFFDNTFFNVEFVISYFPFILIIFSLFY